MPTRQANNADLVEERLQPKSIDQTIEQNLMNRNSPGNFKKIYNSKNIQANPEQKKTIAPKRRIVAIGEHGAKHDNHQESKLKAIQSKISAEKNKLQ